MEQTAYESADAIIAVSDAMCDDILECFPHVDRRRLHVIHSGVDTTKFYPVQESDVLRRHSLDADRPIVLFVGRLTPQKGLQHLIAASYDIDPAAQIVLCATAPDTQELADETEHAITELSEQRPGVVWLREAPALHELRQLLSHASVFVCPSVYEPLGIVNLESLACSTPVVASAVGGIPEIVQHGHNGLLVPYAPDEVPEFRAQLAASVNELLSQPERARSMGRAGRNLVSEMFTWDTTAKQTVHIYETVRAERH